MTLPQISPGAPSKAAVPLFVHVHVRVGNCDIAIAVHQVLQAVPFPPPGLAALPRRTGGLLGVADIAGAAVPIVALERWLPLDAEPDPAVAQKLLVLQHAGAVLGVRVDAVLGVKTVALDAVRKVHQQPDDAELFDAVVPAAANSPTLCILEVARLMRLCNVWCAAAELAPASEQAPGASDGKGPSQAARTQRYALFRSGSQRWAIPAGAVEHVVPVPAAELVLGGNERSWAISQWQGRKLALVDISEGRQASGGAAWMVLLRDGPLLLGLTVSECLQVVDLPSVTMVDIPNEPLLAGVALLPDGGRLKLLDVARLFALTPEAAVSRHLPSASGSGEPTLQSEDAENCPYLVFDAGQRYASAVEGILGVVQLPAETKADLLAGRSSFLAWRGQTIRLVNLPAIGKSAPYDGATLAVIVQAPDDTAGPIGIAVQGLADWLPARSARRSTMRMGAMGEFGMINAKGAENHANLVVIDLAQMAYMLA